MTEQKETRPWSVPVAVADVPEEGRRVALHADDKVRAALARLADVLDVPELDATFDLARHGKDGLRVTGQVEAAVRQTCVVSLEPMTSAIREPIDLLFEPPGDAADTDGEEAEMLAADAAEPPEPLIGGQVDLGAVATEFLLLGIDPYPRRPDAHFEPPRADEEPADHPFAALKGFKAGNKS
jgi:uncharacterized metal-binding protein YceD (DUF177 family)